eukprot:3015930-Amphidinium_carterae.3
MHAELVICSLRKHLLILGAGSCVGPKGLRKGSKVFRQSVQPPSHYGNAILESVLILSSIAACKEESSAEVKHHPKLH